MQFIRNTNAWIVLAKAKSLRAGWSLPLLVSREPGIHIARTSPGQIYNG